jgi:hypothetical protein
VLRSGRYKVIFPKLPLACLIHENQVYIHKHFKADGFEISTRPERKALRDLLKTNPEHKP